MIPFPITDSPAPAFVEIALPLPLRQTFTYSLPAALAENVKIGSRLLVPFGNRQLTGYAVALHTELSADVEIDTQSIKEVLEVIDNEPLLTEEILRLTQWTADYYSASWGEILKASLPAGVNAAVEQIVTITGQGRDEVFKLAAKRLQTPKAQLLQFLVSNEDISTREIAKKFGPSTTSRIVRELVKSGWARTYHRTLTTKVKPKRMKAVRLLPTEMHLEGKKPLTEVHGRVIDTLIAHNGEIGFADLLTAADVRASSIQTLEKRNIVQTFVREVMRDPLKDAKLPALDHFELTDLQTAAFTEISAALETNEYLGFLLHGVTGSGKTEIYIRSMKHALERGKSSLMLVPEIALTPVFSRRLRSVFGDDVAILHSNLSTGERFDEWRRIKSGKARIAIGTRSAIFAPLENIGLIIVDEEHDSSYRQHESPFYHARDVAVVRANNANAIVVLGSATPAVETYYNAQKGKYKYLGLPERIGNRPLAKAEVVDMREAFQVDKKDALFSPQLIEAIGETHARGEQSIILLNRRGFSQFVTCRGCGESMKCQNCEITLTFHKRENVMLCHYCNFRARVPHKCPSCESKYIYFVGEGTEQLEDILQRKFSDLRIARVDRDTTSKRRSFEEILQNFSEKRIDMLVGTQMLAKGHDYPNVTLVGVISVDAGLALPDFRSAERTFQLLTQVAGRAGRGVLPGRVIIQTFHPGHYALRHAVTQNYENFYEEEIKHRTVMGYPPFSAMACITVHHENYNYAFDNAQLFKECLIAANTERKARILGPAPAPLARLKGEHRLQLVIKAVNRKYLRAMVDIALHDAQEKMCDLKTLSVEIDPVNML